MKESYKEDLANHFGLELYADGGNVMGVATTEVYAGKLLSSVPHPYRVPTVSVLREGKIFHCDIGKRWNDSAESKNLSMRRNFNRENRETLSASDAGWQPFCNYPPENMLCPSASRNREALKVQYG